MSELKLNFTTYLLGIFTQISYNIALKSKNLEISLITLF